MYHLVNSSKCSSSYFTQVLEVVWCEIINRFWWHLQLACGLDTLAHSQPVSWSVRYRILVEGADTRWVPCPYPNWAGIELLIMSRVGRRLKRSTYWRLIWSCTTASSSREVTGWETQLQLSASFSLIQLVRGISLMFCHLEIYWTRLYKTLHTYFRHFRTLFQPP